MINYDKLRKMSDEELNNMFKMMTNRNDKKCIKCNSKVTKAIYIHNKETEQRKLLCGLCEDCYEDILDKLETVDILWGEK